MKRKNVDIVVPSIILTVPKDKAGNICVCVITEHGTTSQAATSLEEGLEIGKKLLGIPEKEYILD